MDYLTVSPEPNREIKVLVVEDEPQWQFVLSHTLKSLDRNISVRCVPTASLAEEVLYDDPKYAMIVADYQLDGDLTGVDLWKLCQNEHRPIPFLMYTGADRDKLENLAQVDDFDDLEFLSKQAGVKALRTKLGALLEMREDKQKKWFMFALILALVAGSSGAVLEMRPRAISASTSAKMPSQPAKAPSINVRQIVGPELKAKFNLVLNRADRIVADAKTKRL